MAKQDWEHVGVKAPAPVAGYIRERVARGASKTDVVLRALEIDRDVQAELGAEWHEVAKRAERDGVTFGTALARLALDAIDSTPRRKARG